MPDDYAYLLTEADLDRLPRIRHTPPEERPVAEALLGQRPDPREFVSVEEANRVLAEVRATFARRSAEWDQRSREGREQVARLIEDKRNLGEAVTARAAERDEARRQLVEQGEAAEEQADALRSEVARLSGHLDQRAREAEGLREERDTVREQLREYRASFDPSVEEQALAGRLRAFVRNLAAEDWTPRLGERRWLSERPRKIAASIEDLVLGERVDPQPVVDARTLGRLAEVSPHPVDDDPRRPHLDHYPSDALLLTYRELRQLLALHVEAVGDSLLSAADQARAMRDGETPLRLPEVLGE